MKKYGLIVGLLCCTWFSHGATLPDNIYMRAMQDEIKRSMAKLRRPGVEKPYFMAYKLEQINTGAGTAASFGALYAQEVRDSQLNAYVWVDIGNAQQDSMGYAHEAYYSQHAYRPRQAGDLPKSYKGVRQSLWQLTDKAYTFAAETYQQKQAYERTKQTANKEGLPDVLPAKQAQYVEEIPSLPSYDLKQMQKWVKEQSALGKEVPYLEQFTVSVFPVQQNTYYLNSRGGFYQTSKFAVQVAWSARLRNKEGFKRQYSRSLWLSDFSVENQELAATSTTSFLQELQSFYTAKEGENYVGPVLLMPEAAGWFIQEQLVKNFQNLKALVSAGGEEDPQKGRFEVSGQRIMSPGITVWDEPLLRADKQTPLGGFMPVDDEGVAAETLKLVENGRVVDLPRTTRPFGGKIPSNGHARATYQSLPRERLTNVRVEPEHPLNWNDLWQQLLARCQALNLEYGYIIHQWPKPDSDYLFMLEKVYVDGRSEFVHGLKIGDLTTRSLRDILAVGDTPAVSHIRLTGEELPSQTVTTPALLLEELELVTTDSKPDKKPFVPKP